MRMMHCNCCKLKRFSIITVAMLVAVITPQLWTAPLTLEVGQEWIFDGKGTFSFDRGPRGKGKFEGSIRQVATVLTRGEENKIAALCTTTLKRGQRSSELASLSIYNWDSATRNLEMLGGRANLILRDDPWGIITLPLIWHLPDKLTANIKWENSEFVDLPGIPPDKMQVAYRVLGLEKIGDRECWKIERTLVNQPMRIQLRQGQLYLQLTEHIWLDRSSLTAIGCKHSSTVELKRGNASTKLMRTYELRLSNQRKLSAQQLTQQRKRMLTVFNIAQQIIGITEQATEQQMNVVERTIANAAKDLTDAPYPILMQRIQRVLKLARERWEQSRKVAMMIGKVAPDFTLPTLTGAQIKLSALRGKVVVLNFFASWCGPCNSEAPQMQKEIWQAYKGKGVVVIGINIWERDKPHERAEAFKKKHKLTYTIAVDEAGKVAEQFLVRGVPTNVIIDQDGKVRYLQAGFNLNAIKQMLDKLTSK
ncbi:MAG TPA: TlpA family protein disulfide reductase [Armatimonadetes bacterium]|nr:TlpA family protein disulfide reductase [Armatimonadota bacterium]